MRRIALLPSPQLREMVRKLYNAELRMSEKDKYARRKAYDAMYYAEYGVEQNRKKSLKRMDERRRFVPVLRKG